MAVSEQHGLLFPHNSFIFVQKEGICLIFLLPQKIINMIENTKPKIGFSCGDINGIGLEVIIKTVAESKMLELCTPVIFANNKVINYYRKGLADVSFTMNITKDYNNLNPRQVNVVTAWEEDVVITPGELTETGGKYAWQSLQLAVEALKAKAIDGLVTAPINKKSIQSEEFKYSGHTPYLRDSFEQKDVVMLMCAENMRVAVVTEHLPIEAVAAHITQGTILSKLTLLKESLKKDFGIAKPKIAVLGLNPHAGDGGLIGKEEIDTIEPAIKEAKQKGVLAFGPFPADGFFAHGDYNHFDAVLAMYHDQGLIPFKSLAIGEGVNYTAALPVVRTSPDHGTAFDIAGKGVADPVSTMGAVFMAIDIIKHRQQYEIDHSNPVKKMSEKILANAKDEKVYDN